MHTAGLQPEKCGFSVCPNLDHSREAFPNNNFSGGTKTRSQRSWGRCAVYLPEINLYEELQDLMGINTMNGLGFVARGPAAGRTLGFSDVPQGPSTMPSRQTRGKHCVAEVLQSYEKRSCDIPFNLPESAFTADNAASGFATLNDFKEANVW
ncbi:hypothetical protein MYCTH_90614 [Thermothelomyces thermophilus ATCC 42464]|uniref:Uncharacterized protein n=1 Tax=Thermothelomyces thermophilus (strain ATCC 42464 / BCRC 31852 / DSM 1799) TaxID=573729 RepID=G2QMP3_THET4|nr:uncharacterized protein MYCTH_90614 [Thermothelomyces thermophilus ATCC 42464]AEO61223.1 hypothetical protein MYCTH_90614 [Thermothelomyces thermophilus ATCC 42464]